MTQGLPVNFRAGTRTDYAGPAINTCPSESMRGSVAVVLLRRLVRGLLKCPGAEKTVCRAGIVQFLSKSREAEDCVDELLQLCTTEGGPDGLDQAIDILAKTGGLILDYAWAYLQRDLRVWNPGAGRAYKPNDDYWYVLLRAVGRTSADPKERYREITCCASADSRGMREAVVNGLHDLATPAAKARIRKLAVEDADPYIRQVAQEALEALES